MSQGKNIISKMFSTLAKVDVVLHLDSFDVYITVHYMYETVGWVDVRLEILLHVILLLIFKCMFFVETYSPWSSNADYTSKTIG